MILVVFVILAIMHLSTWILSKGVIYAAKELFAIDWTGKFWAVYVLVLVLWSVINWMAVRK